MKKIKIYYFAALLMILASCENELNIEPAQSLSFDVALSSEANILNIIVGAYAEAGQGASFGGQSQITSDLLGNTDQVTWTGTFLAPRQIINKNLLVDNGWAAADWPNLYEVINQVNLVLDRLDIITSSQSTRDNAEGQAKFLRALAYFDLVRLYALPYEAGTTNSQLGVPLRLTGITDFTQDLSIARSSVEEVYNQIISDLTNAYNLLPDSNGIFADKYAAQAVLARVYLQQGNYEAARDAANDVLTNSGHRLAVTYAGAFNNDTSPSDGEDVFAFQVTDQDGANSLITFYASENNGGRQGDIVIDAGYIALFDDPTNDVRATFNYISPDNGLDLTSKYTNQFGNIPYIRLAEMYLVRAEANFRLGTSVGTDPLTDVNTVRQRANASDLGSLTLDLILNERQLELGFEGFLLHDLKRTQRSVGALPYNDNSLVLPIPQGETDTNSLIQQNPGYGS